MQERKFPLSHGLSGVSERRMNVFRLQVGQYTADGVTTPGGAFRRPCGRRPSASACCTAAAHAPVSPQVGGSVGRRL
jgi:hypothetical protein